MQQGVKAKLPPLLLLLCSRKGQERDALTLGKRHFKRKTNHHIAGFLVSVAFVLESSRKPSEL